MWGSGRETASYKPSFCWQKKRKCQGYNLKWRFVFPFSIQHTHIKKYKRNATLHLLSSPLSVCHRCGRMRIGKKYLPPSSTSRNCKIYFMSFTFCVHSPTPCVLWSWGSFIILNHYFHFKLFSFCFPFTLASPMAKSAEVKVWGHVEEKFVGILSHLKKHFSLGFKRYFLCKLLGEKRNLFLLKFFLLLPFANLGENVALKILRYKIVLQYLIKFKDIRKNPEPSLLLIMIARRVPSDLR